MSQKYIIQGTDVGIGTVTPTTKLNVVDNTSSRYVSEFKQEHADGLGLRIDINSSTTNAALDVTRGSTQLFRVDQNGDVMVNNNAPIDNAILTVRAPNNNNTRPTVVFSNRNTVLTDLFYEVQINGAEIKQKPRRDGSSTTGVNFTLSTEGPYSATGGNIILNPHRYVGIGDMLTPNHELDVDGDVRIRESNTLKFGGTGAADSKYEIVYNSVGETLDFNFIG